LGELLAELALAQVHFRVAVEDLAHDAAAGQDEVALVQVGLGGLDQVGVEDETGLGPGVLDLGRVLLEGGNHLPRDRDRLVIDAGVEVRVELLAALLEALLDL
jgi:hypothetical protein